MPIFKSTYNILKLPDQDEVFESKWFESNKLTLPSGGPDDKKNHWDYNRQIKLEDVDIWEVLYEATGGYGVYAAWKPYAEFYMMTVGWLPLRSDQYVNDRIVETFYGKNAQAEVLIRSNQLNIPLTIRPVWVDDDQMWLYSNDPEDKKIIIV